MVLAEAVLTSTHNLCFEQKYEKYQNFSSENVQFLEVKFSIYLNRRVFLMICIPVFNANSADPDPTPLSVVSVLGLHCLPLSLFALCVTI